MITQIINPIITFILFIIIGGGLVIIALYIIACFIGDYNTEPVEEEYNKFDYIDHSIALKEMDNQIQSLFKKIEELERKVK